MNDTASTRGICPSCEREGRIGHLCERGACERHGTHYIPARFITGRHRDPRLGQLIARHLLVERLTRPDIDLLYRAIQMPALLEVQLALVPVDRPTDVHDNLLRQALALGRLGGHPNIARLVLFGAEPEGTFLAFESPAEASTLADVVTPEGNDPVPSAAARVLLEPLAAALEALKRAHLVHGEIRPDNILVHAYAGHEAFVQLAGFVRIPPPDAAPPLGLHTQVWRPPEQIFQHAVNATTDAYSVAAIAFSLLFGRAPFPADDRDELYAAKRDASFDPCDGLAAAVPGEVLHFFQGALAALPDGRFNHDGFRNALFAALDALALAEAGVESEGTDVWQPSSDLAPIREDDATPSEPSSDRPPRFHRAKVHDAPIDDAPSAGRLPRFHRDSGADALPDEAPRAGRPPRFHHDKAAPAADDEAAPSGRLPRFHPTEDDEPAPATESTRPHGEHSTQQMSVDELEGLASRRGTPRMHKDGS